VGIVLYVVYLAIARLYTSPVASVPGPRLAALTFWYEFYYDVVLRGRYMWKIAELHQQYGPIIRINPYEVKTQLLSSPVTGWAGEALLITLGQIHINDPDFYDEVYVSARTNMSCKVAMFGTPHSLLATIEHDVHRRRRNAYASYFSKQSINRYSGVIQEAVKKVCTRFEEHRMKGEKINLMHAYCAMAGDVVSGYCFPKSYGLLDQPNFAPDYHDLWISILSNSHVLKQFPWIFPLMLSFPDWFVERFLHDIAVTYKWQREWRKQIQAVKSGDDADDREKRGGRSSIFEAALDSDLPPFDKSVSRLVDDAQTLVGAGSITTSFSLAVGTYYIASDADVLEKLVVELEAAMPSPEKLLPLGELEKLPYLTAVHMEILRISYGVSHRLQRVCPNQSVQYHDYTLPPGTPISMSTPHIHDNPDIFPDPRTFKPERWLPLETTGARLQKYLVAFSRGSRQCLGMHLGSAEIYMGIAGVFRRFGRRMEIVDTVKERDVEVSHDFFTPFTRRDSKGIMLQVG
ncbi:MAG: hypothetical protein Q9218_005875, partial [Villophora microphyllina]